MSAILHAEWTKFRTVRGWIIGMIVGAILIVFLGVFLANVSIGCVQGNVQLSGRACLPKVPIGPGGEAVTDSFFFVHQPLTGNGSITARVTSLTGTHAVPSGGTSHVAAAGQPGGGQPMEPGLVPWAKTGIIIKQSTAQGSAYAAMLVSGSHGVRMQYNFTGDLAGLPGAVSARDPRWLRLVRAGYVVTGYDSANGTRWTRVGTVTLTGLRATVQVGLFATSPQYTKSSPFFGGLSSQTGPSTATGAFDRIGLTGRPSGSRWSGVDVGGTSRFGPPLAGGFRPSAAGFTVTGSGDIAPIVPGPGGQGVPTATIEQSLAGGFAGMIAFIAVGALFFTSEYRRGLIRTTLAASPRRGEVLAAKAIVAGLAAFAVGLITCVVAIMLGVPRERTEGLFVLPVPALTEVRVIVGTAAMFALIAVIAVALGAVLRQSAVTITVVLAAVVLPFLLAVTGVLPAGPADWLLRLTPAAGYAIEQSIPRYSQVSGVYSPAGGQYPLSPLAGLAVLMAWAAAAYVLALILIRRRDA
jgi:ABC-type transport system involved in multi-copper enzyme maturation permease subunit